MTKKVVLVTSGQPSINPRLVKEADALSDAGYNVTVFYAYWNEWATKYDEQLLANSKWKAVRVGGAPMQGRFTYLFSRLLYKFSRAFRHPLLAVSGSSRASFHLLQEVKKHKADLYIAHNLGALPAAFKAAKKYSKPCGFDAEDFHRNEVTNDDSSDDVIRKSTIEDKYIPRVNYVTASSPQIAELYRGVFPAVNPIVVLNVFNAVEIPPLKVNRPLRVFWVSQTIGTGRGIEDVVEALATLSPADFELHLLGNSSPNNAFTNKLKSGSSIVKFHAPVSPGELITFAAQFDIGLALEPGFSKNNDAALSNKLFTYMQAGLAVVATNTNAQADFMTQNQTIGSSYNSGDVKALAGILTGFQQNPDKLLACKQASLRLAHLKYNWKLESQKFLALMAQTI